METHHIERRHVLNGGKRGRRQTGLKEVRVKSFRRVDSTKKRQTTSLVGRIDYRRIFDVISSFQIGSLSQTCKIYRLFCCSFFFFVVLRSYNGRPRRLRFFRKLEVKSCLCQCHTSRRPAFHDPTGNLEKICVP